MAQTAAIVNTSAAANASPVLTLLVLRPALDASSLVRVESERL
jgi:hypothetical protein